MSEKDQRPPREEAPRSIPPAAKRTHEGNVVGEGGNRKQAVDPQITVDQEFRSLVPPLSTDERRQLEDNIRQDGCREPLVVWNDIILDGHNRYEICQKHNLVCGKTQVHFENRTAAQEWVIRNQFGRRNISLAQRAELAIKLEPLIASRSRQGERTDLSANSPKSKPLDTREEVAKVAGVSSNTISHVKHIMDRAPEETKAKVRTGEESINKAYRDMCRQETEEKREKRREENRRKVAATPDPLEAGAVFSTIVSDPPWDLKGDDLFGQGRPPYPTLSLDELRELPVLKLADEDCHLYLWVTNRNLRCGFELLEAWGFRYVSCVTWCKPSIGMGAYFRGSTEHVLFGIKGSQPLKRKDVGTWHEWPRGPQGHSSKPPEFIDLVESCSPGPYLEMFARSKREGWTQWGAEANHDVSTGEATE